MTQIKTHEQIEMLAPSSLKEGRKEQSGWRWLIAALVMLAVIGVLGAEIRSRVKAATNLRAVTSQMAVPSVSVVLPKQTAPAQEIVPVRTAIVMGKAGVARHQAERLLAASRGRVRQALGE